MADRVQPGGRVDEDVYERFREHVREEHGVVRGNMGRELEAAMRAYMDASHGNDQLTRIENDIATLKARLADAESTAQADGGETVAAPPAPSSGRAHTHTPNDTQTDADTHADTDEDRSELPKPDSKASRQAKVEWLVEERIGRDTGSAPPQHFIDRVKDEWGFERRTAKKYLQPIIDALDAKRHPEHDLLVWGERLAKVREEYADDDGQDVAP